MRICNSYFVAAFALASLFGATAALAQEAPPSQFEHIQGLDPFAGFWEGKSPEEGGGTIYLSCRYAANRSYLQMQLSMEVEGERESMGTMLIGKNHANDQVSIWGFWPNRQIQGDNVQIGEDSASWKETGTDEGGQKSSANVVMKVTGDELTVDVTEARIGQQEGPEMHIVFKRSQRRGDRQ